MAGRPIELHAAIALAPPATREGMTRVLRSMAGGSPGDDVPAPLSLYLRDLHVSVKGRITIPAEVQIREHGGGWECALAIEATSGGGFFPTFTGTLRISPVGDHCELALIGEYGPPLTAIGELDEMVPHRAARRSLESFLSRIANDIIENARDAAGSG